jgi:hypothetical protein
MRSVFVRLLSVLLPGALAFAGASCDASDPTRPIPRPTAIVTPTGLVSDIPPEIFVGAGDVGTCNNNNDEATAKLLDNIPGTVFLLGDNVYENGTTTEFQNCYEPTWGRHRARTKPSAGNHDYNTSGAAGYYGYFGAAAGDPTKGYYSFELGAWHIIVLNSNVSMKVTSAQVAWLKADLAAHPNLCTAAYWHHPLYSSTGGTGSGGVTYSSVRPLVDALYAGGADLILAGHRHFYERMVPIKPDGSPDAAFGIRQIIAGSGGRSGGAVTNAFPASEVRNGSTYGVLKLHLYEDSYAWKFVPVAGKTFTDSGSTACHGAPGGPPPAGSISAALSTVSVEPATLTAGSGAATITVTAKDASGNPVTGATVAISVTGSLNTLTQPVGPTGADGVATGTLSSTVAQDKVVSAIINGIAITQRPTVTVSPGPATRLGFTSQPANTSPGTLMTPAVKVGLFDQFTNQVSSSADITMAISSNPSGGTLAGTTTVTAFGGVASFTDLSIDLEGAGYRLTATAPGLSGATSNTFEVAAGSVSTITTALLTAGSNAVNQRVYQTAAVSPAPNTLVTLAVLGRNQAGASPDPVVTGGGMTSWTVVASMTFDVVGAPTRRLTVYRAMSPAPGSGPITITFAGTAQGNAQWIVSQWDGVDLSGENGAGAIVQAGTAQGDAVSGLTVPLAVFGHANNVAYGAFGVAKNVVTVTPGLGFTEISEQPSGESTPGDLQTQWAMNLNTILASWTALHGAAVGIEIKARTN